MLFWSDRSEIDQKQAPNYLERLTAAASTDVAQSFFDSIEGKLEMF